MATPLPAASPDALVASLEDEAVVLDLVSKRYFQLNVTGSIIWEGIASGDDRDEVVRRLVDAFEITPEGASEAIDTFVAELRSRGLVRDR